MALSQVSQTTKQANRYYISTRIMIERGAIVVAAILIVPVGLALSGERVDGLMIGLFAFMIALCLGVFAYFGRASWLEVSDEGIAYKGPGMTIATTWDNIESIGEQFVTGEGRVEGLKLINSGLDVNGVLKAGAMFSWRATMSMRDYEYFLPISSMQTRAWRDTPFGQDVRRRAPRLFAGE